jgi:uncharacterized membrane protein SirB2
MDYLAIKHFHMAFALASGSLFLLRGVWMLQESAMLQRRWVKSVPHIVDTLLLISAVIMAVWSGQYPFVQSWLTAKVIALIAYIALGAIALKRGRSKTVRACAFIAALAVFFYIGSVAMTKQALVFF